MLSFPASLRVFIALAPCDMRAGINALVADRLKDEVRGGALFVFTNKRHHLIKVLHLDGTGCWLMTKRWRKARSSGRVRPRRDR